ncbi:MAG: hypothetical protein VX778_03460, partial [Candidatus Thermoplasmatota archaeon]|nr:hypothetical protein [Candidatus Thermoplasmatota archaeon]
TVTWNGLISQQFYDVESVLLGGALGSTNTAVSIIIVLLLMIFVVLVVLIRRGNAKEEEWDEEDYYDDEEIDEEDVVDDEEDDVDASAPVAEPESTTHSEPELARDLRQELATKAGQVGVMQAAPGTNQGETGWYVDASTELQYWNVGSDGSWTRVQ